jgi:HSP20 family protein
MRNLTPYWTNRNLVSDLFDEMDDYFFSGGTRNWPEKAYYDEAHSFGPACEISESEDHYSLSVDLPGMREEDIKVEVHNNQLVISGERKREKTVETNQKVQRYEKSYGSFRRSFTLPTTVEEAKIEARYENGVLDLYLPKVAESKPRQIEISKGKTGFFSKLTGSDKSELKDKKN